MTVIAKPSRSTGTRVHKPGKKAAAAKVATPAIVEAAGRDVLVPLDRLFISDANVRKVHHEEGLIELAALIEAQGLLQRLSVVAHSDSRSRWWPAGGARAQCMRLLAESGRWSASQPVECRLYEAAQAVQVSLAENSARAAIIQPTRWKHSSG
jgi:ParB family chromosome partitioning protein